MARIAKSLDVLSNHDRLELWKRIQNVGWTRAQHSGCLEYKGFRNEHGYGQYRYGGRLHRVHRVAFECLVGPLSASDVVMHLCDNPACSEPNHLRKGSQTDNLKDMWAKGRAHKSGMTVCPNGHVYPPDRPEKIDSNRCRECARDRNRRYHQRKKEVANGVAAG